MSIRRSAALRFLYALPIVWLGVRLPVAIGSVETLLHPTRYTAIARPPVPPHKAIEVRQLGAPPLQMRQTTATRIGGRTGKAPIPAKNMMQQPVLATAPQPDLPITTVPANPGQAWQLADAAYAQLRQGRRREAAALLREANTVSPNAAWQRDLASLTSHWHGDAWLLARNGGGSLLGVNAPALGRSQLGTRIDYLPDPLDPRQLMIEARLARPFRGGATQLATGVGIRPVAALPLRITLERRIATGHGTRDAWSLRGEGGVSAIALPGQLRLDAYGEAGMVGARSNDLFADGDVHITRRIRPAIGIGAGLWAATQPGAQRIDIGPAIVGRLRHGRIGLSASVDYRLRIAGNARPDSGPALTIAAGF